MRNRLSTIAFLAAFALSGCSGPIVKTVDDGVYGALVPSSEQFAVEAAMDIPGGFKELRADGIDQIELTIRGDEVSFRIDGSGAVTRRVEERLVLTDRDGSGPFKGKEEVLVLGGGPLLFGDLVVDEPVIWPGSFDESPVITLKPRDPEERGLPGASCGSDENCLLLSSGASPEGRYEDANNPQLGENPIASIEVRADYIEFTLDSGQQIRISRGNELHTRACGLSETAVWDVPAEIGLDMRDPVLVHTLCPTTPGAGIQLTIMERAEVPVLAPLSAEIEDWCLAGPTCLWFAPV